MGLISTGVNLTKTIRNIGRLREIVTVFASHGLDEFISKNVLLKIPNFALPKSTKKRVKDEIQERGESSWGEVIGVRLKLSFEELGPAFVKFGQLLGSREDIFNDDFIKQMQLLRDKVSPLNFSEVREQVEESLGRKAEDVFSIIIEEPIGTASIGLVYKAKLKTGEDVVLKVRRPEIERSIETDLSVLQFIAEQSEKAGEEIRFLGISKILQDFAVSLHNELNFNIEANNCEKLRKIIEKYDGDSFYIPKIYSEYTKDNLLVMELIDGTPFSDEDKINEVIEELRTKLDTSVDVFIKTFLNEGFFHADLHGGNFFYTRDKKIALIDFGLVGSLSRNGRQNFLAIIYSILTYNFENLVYEFLDVAEFETVPDVDKLISDIKYALSPHIGLTVQQTNFSIVLRSIVKTLREHQIFLPREWYVVFRALMTLDGVGKSLGIDFDIFKILEKDIDGLIKSNFNKEALTEDAGWLARDILLSARSLPRHIKWFSKEWAKNGYAFELKHLGVERAFDNLSNAIIFLGYCIIASILFYTGATLVDTSTLANAKMNDLPAMTYIFWGAASFLVFVGLQKK